MHYAGNEHAKGVKLKWIMNLIVNYQWCSQGLKVQGQGQGLEVRGQG